MATYFDGRTSKNDDAGRGPSREYAVMGNYLDARSNRFANLMDEVPGLSRAVMGMCEGILRIIEEKNIDPQKLKPRAKITPDGLVFIDLNIPR